MTCSQKKAIAPLRPTHPCGLCICVLQTLYICLVREKEEEEEKKTTTKCIVLTANMYMFYVCIKSTVLNRIENVLRGTSYVQCVVFRKPRPRPSGLYGTWNIRGIFVSHCAHMEFLRLVLFMRSHLRHREYLGNPHKNAWVCGHRYRRPCRDHATRTHTLHLRGNIEPRALFVTTYYVVIYWEEAISNTSFEENKIKCEQKKIENKNEEDSRFWSR